MFWHFLHSFHAELATVSCFLLPLRKFTIQATCNSPHPLESLYYKWKYNVQNRKSTCFTTRKGYVWTKYNSYCTYNTMERQALLILFMSSVWIAGDFSHRLFAQSCTEPSNGCQACFFPHLPESCFEMSQSKTLKCQRIWFKKKSQYWLD